MKTSRYTEARILAILRQAGGGMPVTELCRAHGMSSASFNKGRTKYGGIDASLISQMKTMEEEHRRLKWMVERFTALGGRIEAGEVVDFTRADRIREVVLRDDHRLAADEVVICAGAVSPLLEKMLGEPIPLETERGYHTQIMAPGISKKYSIFWFAKAFMVSSTAGGIRVGGTVEMAGLDAAPDYRRAKVTVKRAKEALPNLKCEDFTEWMGHRPALPDAVPILSASAKIKGFFYPTGRGHLGLTYAATTAQLMGQLITGAKPEVDFHPC